MFQQTKMFSLIVLFSMILSACCHDDHLAQDDKHLHESQIPPPNLQPKHEDIVGLLEKVFQQMDKDQDSLIETNELKLWLDDIHKNLINENIQQQWAYYNPPVTEVHSWESYDPEKKEVLTWEHYMNTTYTSDIIEAFNANLDVNSVKSEDPNFPSYYIMLKRAEKRWKAADSNNDTVLTLEEFKTFLHPDEAEATKHLLVEEAMDDMDHDKNGEISLQEYLKHMTDVSSDEEKKDPNFLSVSRKLKNSD